MEVICR